MKLIEKIKRLFSGRERENGDAAALLYRDGKERGRERKADGEKTKIKKTAKKENPEKKEKKRSEERQRQESRKMPEEMKTAKDRKSRKAPEETKEVKRQRDRKAPEETKEVKRQRDRKAPEETKGTKRQKDRKAPEEMSPLDREEFIRRRQVILDVMNEKAYVPMKLRELAILLDIPRERRGELKRVVESLLEEGKISISQKGKLGRPELFAVSGDFTGHPKGFGFVTVEGREQDIFIPADQVNGAMHGDRVQITIEEEKAGRRAEGRVIRVLERANVQVVGLYEKSKGFGFVIPDNPRLSQDIFIPQGQDGGAVTGHKVVVKIRNFGGGRGQKPEGAVTEILGHINDPGVDVESIVRAYGLPEEFPPEVMAEAEAVPDTVGPEDLKGRKDLRMLKTVTIDGEEAKDLDDAITLERRDGGYRLGVHIADVSFYVREDSALDREALRRGTSVYLTDRVIPMLPHRLSNGICSLNQGEDRLALSCLMDIDEKGAVTGHEIAETVIRVDRRMTYTAVNAILTGADAQTQREYRDFSELFFLMDELAKKLRERRRKRGSIDFDFPESKILLDETGRPVEIKPHERNAATQLIEDFMLLANETVAEDYYWQQVPFLYRTHEKPEEEKMAKLGTFINSFGYTLRMPGGEAHPKEIQKLLDKVAGTPEEALISRLTLRSMKQARYTTESTGHFGLAAPYYTHFTSPIRRYPDLQIHRIIRESLRGGLTPKRVQHYEKLLPGVAAQASALERRAEEAERDTDKMKKVQYMEQFIGESFDGVISGVTGWGFYVELPNTVEGLVHINELRDDYYLFDEEHYLLMGEMTRRTYRLGQPIRITVTGCDRLARTIDFAPAQGRHC